MRGRREYPVARGAALRIVALGDSFTFGQCVGDDESFPAQLERLIAPGEVLNLAVHGYGHDQMLLRLRRDGLPYRPDLVLLGFFNPDIERNQLHFRDYAKPRFRLSSGRLVLENVPVPSPEEFASGFHLRSANYARMLRDTLFADRLERRNRRRSEAILRALAAESRAAGARLVLVYIPSENQSRAGRSWPRSPYRHVCEAKEALCIDPTPRLAAFLGGEPDPAAHFRCHFSAAVHRVIAEEIAAALGAAGLLTPSR
jgi:lysophospholipase L1-like esterase